MKYIFIFVVLALSNCAPSTTATMETWVGQPEPDLLSSWGAPDRTIFYDDRIIHTWDGRNAHGEIICARTFVVKKAAIESFSTNCFF